jgi:hypothetical protein
MYLKRCQKPCIILTAVFAIAELGGSASLGQAALLPAVRVVSIDRLSGEVWPVDLNRDGVTDLAASDGPPHAGGRVQAVLGRGDGTFGPPLPTSFAGTVEAAGDFNADGFADLVVADGARVAILPGVGNGTFSPAREIGSREFFTFALATDFNGDGRRDIAIATEPDALDVYPGRGDFTFGAPTRLATGLFPHDGMVVDLNGDGRRDIVVANRYSNSLSVFRNQGGLLFASTEIALDSAAIDVTARDVNGDGRIDLLAATRQPADDINAPFRAGDAQVLLATAPAGSVFR